MATDEHSNLTESSQYASVKWISVLAKLTSWTTLFLIFVGGMVKSTDSGLAVPDWPLSYGTLFPPMVGGIFYEHGHRMVASLVGFMMLCLAIGLAMKEKRGWLKKIGFTALGVVILQGVLGGLTVLFFLPTWISASHGILAQTFFLLTIFIGYSLSHERRLRQTESFEGKATFTKFLIFFILLIYMQLFLGALTRHTESGLAIYDFPTMAGQWIPSFDHSMLQSINSWRFEQNLPYVNKDQVLMHFLHRCGAFVLVAALCFLNHLGIKYYADHRKVLNTLFLVDLFVFVQVLLGISTVLTLKEPITTSFHVVTGAAILGLTFLLFLRTVPVKWDKAKKVIF
jgi:cytochrome c oxidase assembly protein subunit 15